MNAEQMALFVELVKTNASWRAFEKRLGLTRPAYHAHVARMAEYEAILAAASCKKTSLKEKTKEVLDKLPVPKKAKSELKSKIVSKEKEEELDEEDKTL